ncbi:hypothetical protein DY000_02025478 [Brassica cretica]|uniref:Uncharacterized protein n=1 Tax=Brassica cretica TaxID=69181 RepID=A0ABQ7E767_BRACR|nr:hypothetical protein DY000_02025478 [Brassica cretica]
MSLRPSGATSVGRSERSFRASFCVVSPWKRERPRSVALASRSGLRERPQWVALRGRSERSLRASFCVVSPWKRERPRRVAPGCVSQRLHGVAPVRSLWCAAHPLIVLNTSFELQMHPNASKNFMWYSNT